jgi:anti-sigma factor RsiW
MSHLDEFTLNAYLDAVLDPRAAAEATAHLAACPNCAARLGRLQQTMTEVAALPDLPLARDLSRGVVAALQARPRADLDPRARVVFGLQFLAAAAALAAAIPLALALLPDSAALLTPVDWAAPAAEILNGIVAQWLAVLAGASAWLAGAPAVPPVPGMPGLSGLALGGAAAAAVLLFVIGNGVLLRATFARPRVKAS